MPDGAGQYGDLARHPDNEASDGVAVLRVESGLFFANADAVRAALLAAAGEDGIDEHLLAVHPSVRDAVAASRAGRAGAAGEITLGG